jgi:predicted esterase
MPDRSDHASNYHGGQPVAAAGPPLESAEAVVILVHGRGDSAEGIMGLAEVLDQPTFAFLAPQARGFQWYPNSFLAPLDANEPYLTSALASLDAMVRRTAEAGFPADRVVIAGFSQGACLACEYVARNAQRYGGLIAFSGGLIGSGQRPGFLPPDDKMFEYDGDLAGTPVFIGCSDVDPHIPLGRVERTAEVLRSLGAEVTKRIYPRMGHTINEDEIAGAHALLGGL